MENNNNTPRCAWFQPQTVKEHLRAEADRHHAAAASADSVWMRRHHEARAQSFTQSYVDAMNAQLGLSPKK